MAERVSIIQPYVPAYRAPLFTELARLLAEHDLELEVLTGGKPRRESQRGDDVGHESARGVGSNAITVRGHHLRYRHVLRATSRSALVVCEHASGALDTSALLLRRRVPVAVWGHARPFVAAGNAVDERIERWQIERARHVFTYTDEGTEFVRRFRDPADVTTLRNATDTRSLRLLIDALTPEEVREFEDRHALGGARVLVFVGGLDDSKRLPLLLEVARAVHEVEPSVVLVIAGDGGMRGYVERAAAEQPWVRAIGRADPPTLAVLARVGAFMLNPGRVGLVAVDSLAMELPIVTTDQAGHAPEFAYLRDGVDSVVTTDDATALTRAALDLLGDDGALTALKRGCREASSLYSVEAMAANFRDGIRTALTRS